MGVVGAEQAGYADLGGKRLEMAGGEFCANACLAYGALLNLNSLEPDSLKIAGMRVELFATGEAPKWRCGALFDIGNIASEDIGGIAICRMGAISHALIECEALPDAGKARSQALEMIGSLGLADEPACGVVWWRRDGDGLEIMPVVMVPGAGTCNLEGACGSGSLAAALGLGSGRHSLKQPSGQNLEVEIRDGRALIEGPVKLLAEGRLWL